jgi:hypothetical protein
MAPGGANVSVTLPNAGAYTLNANYAGDKLYAASTNTATVTVNGFATALKITATSAEKVGAAFNATVLLTTTGSTAAPTGNVVITATPAVGSPATIATITATSAFATGGAVVPVTLNNVGSYTLNTTYAGAGPYVGSSGTATIAVAGIATVLTLKIDPAAPVANAPFLADETFSTPGSTVAPTGNVTVTVAYNGGTPVLNSTIAASDLLANPAQVNLKSGDPGTYVVTAVYEGGGIYAPSSATVNFTIVISPSTLTLTGPSTGSVGTAVNFNLAFKTTADGPTGNVTLTSTLNGAAGPSVTIVASELALESTAMVPLTFATGGAYTLQASYPGDASTLPSNSNTLAFNVAAYTGPPSFTFTRDSANFNVHVTSKTTPAVVPVTFTSINGFSTPVVLSFGTAGQPDTPLTKDNSTFLFVAVDHTTQKPITSVTPLKAGAHVDLLVEYSDGTYAHNQNPFESRVIYLGFGLGFLGLFGIRKRFRKISAALLAACFLVGAASMMAGCGSTTATYVVTATPTDNTTPAQTIQITVNSR